MRSTTMHRIVALAATAVAFAAACGGDASSAEKSGGEPPPVTLRLGTVESEPIPYAPYVKEFVRAVEETSGGSIDVEVAWEAVPWTPESEGVLATMVSDGDIDLALVPTRGGWDGLGVASLRALQAPFLVDSVELLNAIVTSELADEVMAGLDAVGIEGLALWPDGLRHPVGFQQPLLTAADFEGAQLTYPTSDTALQLFRALGVEPLAGSTMGAVGVDGVEASFNIAPNLSAPGTFTANITFYPKVNALVANAEVLESLTDDQRDALRQAATDTTAYAAATNRTEADMAEQYCADGGSVALADPADLAELAELAAPVVAELETDDTTRRIIDEIRELKSTVTADPATAAAACGPAVEEEVVPTGSESASFPEGAYRTESPIDGVVTMEYRDGVWRRYWESGELDCEATYVLEDGRIWLTTSTDPALACGNVPGRLFLDAAWTLEGDVLRFVDINSDPNAVAEFGLPWTRIEGADQPDTEAASFPDGVYQMETSPEAIIAHGGDSGQARSLGGVNTLIFDNGTWQHLDSTGSPVVGTYAVDAGRVAVEAPGFGQIIDASWTLDGDQLHFTDVNPLNPDERDKRLFEWFWGGPWTRIDDASVPGDEEETGDSGG